MRQTLFPPKKPTLAFPRPSSRWLIHFLVKKYRLFILKTLPFAVLRRASNLALKRPGQWRRRLNLWSPESMLGQTISNEGNVFQFLSCTVLLWKVLHWNIFSGFKKVSDSVSNCSRISPRQKVPSSIYAFEIFCGKLPIMKVNIPKH